MVLLFLLVNKQQVLFISSQILMLQTKIYSDFQIRNLIGAREKWQYHQEIN